MFDILIFILFCIYNSKLARKKGLEPTPWVWRTIGAMFLGIFIGSIFVSMGYHGARDVASMIRYFSNNPLKLLTIYALEIGGGLLVRYLIERKPDATNQE